jgi:hypothetical protein
MAPAGLKNKAARRLPVALLVFLMPADAGLEAQL